MNTLNISPAARLVLAFSCVLVMSTFAIADHNTPEALEARTTPAGKLNVVAVGSEAVVEIAGAGQSAQQDGESVYNSVCATCHGAGIAGAPKTGDVAAWDARIAQGMTVLVMHAIDGFQGETGFMIARGGNAALSDDAVAAAVKHMVEKSQ